MGLTGQVGMRAGAGHPDSEGGRVTVLTCKQVQVSGVAVQLLPLQCPA